MTNEQIHPFLKKDCVVEVEGVGKLFGPLIANGDETYRIASGLPSTIEKQEHVIRFRASQVSNIRLL